MRNTFHVGAVGKRIGIANIGRDPEITPRQALELAAWLVATALPLLPGEPDIELQAFLRLIVDAAEEDSPTGTAVRAELER